MKNKKPYGFINKNRCNSVIADQPDSQEIGFVKDSSISEAMIVRQPKGTSFVSVFKSERNKTLLLLNTLSICGKLLFSMFSMIIMNLLFSSVQFYMMKNTSGKDIDIYSICGIFGIIPHIFVLLLGILVEGKITRRPTLMECFSICLSGLIIYGMMPLAYFKVFVHLDSNFMFLVELIFIISVSVGSYIFKIEKWPKLKNPETVILFSGFLVSVVLSSIFIFCQMNYDVLKSVSLQNLIIIVTMTVFLFITLTYARNYQHIRFLKKQRSIFYQKPITFVGMNGILASPILITIYLTITIVRWNSIKDQLLTTQYSIYVLLVSIVFGIIMNILSILAFSMTSPLYAHCFFPFRIMFDLIFQYALFEKKASIGIYILSVLGISPGILGFFGKYKILKKTTI